MDKPKYWEAFQDFAKQKLLQAQKINENKPHLHFMLEPSFDKHVFLQIQFADNKCKWMRTTWMQLIDERKFNDPIENLKYIGISIEPTLLLEDGEVNSEIIKPILNFIKTMQIQPIIEKEEHFVIDGIYTTITIGNNKSIITYKWHHLPKQWKDLEKLSDMFEFLNEQLQSPPIHPHQDSLNQR
jgi:hypothetical protein